MRKGFTILELLVASLLLGMLTTILTMIFNQSAIAWRTGSAMVADLDDVRDNIAELREESDNAFVWNGEVYRVTGLWDSTGKLNVRACCGQNVNCSNDGNDNRRNRANMLENRNFQPQSVAWSAGLNVFQVGQGDGGRSAKTYTVNVKSAGPDREFNTYDDVWSFPDDFD